MPASVATTEELQAVAAAAQNADGQLSTRIDATNGVLSAVGARVTTLEEAGPGPVDPGPEAPPTTTTREPIPGLVLLDSWTGTDDERLAAAMAYCAAQTHKPKIGYGRRTTRFTRAITPYTGFAFGPVYDAPIEQKRGGNPYAGDVKIAVPSSSTNPFGTWLRLPVGETHKTDISGVYEGSGLKSSFADTDSGGVLWTSTWHDLGMTNFQHVVGNDAKKMLITMSALFDGHCNINNVLGASIRVGGSDCSLFTGARSNIDGKPAAATAAANRFHVWLDGLQKTDVGNAYVTAEGAWGALRITGGTVDNLAGSSELDIIGFLGEGRNAGQPSTGPLIVQEGGEVYYHRVKTNYGTGPQMVLVKGGRATFDRHGYLRANGVDENRPMIERTGGEVEVRGARRSGAGWSGTKPLVKGLADIDASVRAG